MAALLVDQAVARHVHHGAGDQRRGAALVGGEADIGLGPLPHVVHVLRPDARLDDQALLRRHDLHQHLARADHRAGVEHAKPDHFAVDRRGDLLALGGVARGADALLEVEHARARLFQLVGRGLHVGVAHGQDAELELGGALARLGELGAPLAVPRLVFGDRALQGEQARALHVALGEEPLVGLELFLLQLERARLGGDLQLERLGLLPGLADLPAQHLDLAVERLPARTEQRLFARAEFVFQQVLGEHRARGERALGLEARGLGALGVELRAQEVELRVDAHVVEQYQLLALRDAVAVAHAHGAHDAAFLVLHHLAVEVDLDEARGDDRAGKRRPEPPQAHGERADHDHREAAADDALRFLLGIHAAWRVTRAMTSARRPKLATAPSFSTSILSTLRSSEGRWAMTTTVTPSALSVSRVRSSASSPSWSRLAFGSSSTTSRGLPYSARASAMRWRCPGESACPASPISVS